MVSTYKFRIITFITKETNFRRTIHHSISILSLLLICCICVSNVTLIALLYVIAPYCSMWMTHLTLYLQEFHPYILTLPPFSRVNSTPLNMYAWGHVQHNKSNDNNQYFILVHCFPKQASAHCTSSQDRKCPCCYHVGANSPYCSAFLNCELLSDILERQT